MRICVGYYGQARRLSGKSVEEVQLNGDGTVLNLAKAIAVGPLKDLLLDGSDAVRTTIMISVNGAHVRDHSSVLSDGDGVDIHTPLAGG